MLQTADKTSTTDKMDPPDPAAAARAEYRAALAKLLTAAKAFGGALDAADEAHERLRLTTKLPAATLVFPNMLWRRFIWYGKPAAGPFGAAITKLEKTIASLA